MNLLNSAKAGGAGIAVVMAWITTNFGEAFYVLAVLLIIDMILNYANETQFIQKTGNILLGTAAAFYIQNMTMTGLEIAHGLVIVLALNELTQVGTAIKAKLTAYKASNPSDASAVDAGQLLVDQITAKVLEGLYPKEEIIYSKAAGPAVDAKTKPLSLRLDKPLKPLPKAVDAKTKEGVNGE